MLKVPFLISNCEFFFSEQGIFIFSMIQYRPLTMAGYTYPAWAQVLGWIIAFTSVLCIPLGMVHAVRTAKGSNLLKVIIMCTILLFRIFLRENFGENAKILYLCAQKFRNSLKPQLLEERSEPVIEESSQVDAIKLPFSDQTHTQWISEK